MGAARENVFELGTDGPTAIVVGVDGSTTSMRAGAYAAGLARRQRARLIIVYVVSPGGLAELTPEAVVQAQRAHQEIVEELRQQAEHARARYGLTYTFLVVRGDPYRELVRIAEEQRADAIVVGASTGFGHRVMGSLAVRLVRARRWPVTVVP